MNFPNKIILFLLSLLVSQAYASPAAIHQHVVVAPNCLVQQLKNDYKLLAAVSFLSLISVDETGIHQLIKTKNENKKLCGGFMDVTQKWKQYYNPKLSAGKNSQTFLMLYLPKKQTDRRFYQIKYTKEVEQLLKQINPQAMWSSLTALTNFKDRYAGSANGTKAANWLKTQIETSAKNNHREDVKVYFINTPRYQQPSLIAKVGSGTGPGIVIGAHMDTLDSYFSNKPGADDDGSGSVTVLETLRTVLASGMQFKKPIYFIWYAAEEEGLVGSEKVVSVFKDENIPVDAVLHFDMTGYAYKNEPAMWLMDDYVNTDLVSFLEKLITTYVKQPVKHSRCGYACSDHASWTQEGYKAAIPAEAAYEHTNPHMHSSNDVQDHLSLSHMTDYLKLAAAFAVEMAEPR
jgi:bacterial leucyl aminopeptidase